MDAGFSGAEIQRRMAARGLDAADLDAILVTHEHGDHIQGVGVLARRFKLPVHITRRTLQAAARQLGSIDTPRHFEGGRSFTLGNLTVHPFSISHDAEDPVGFTVACNGVKVGIATDLGVATHVVKAHLKNCSLLILEANHDPQLLAKGPYPWPLKQRVSGRTGHLSNEASMTLLEEIQHDRLSHVILAHLSEVNNTPQHAFGAAVRGITRCSPILTVADQHESGDVVYLK